VVITVLVAVAAVTVEVNVTGLTAFCV